MLKEEGNVRSTFLPILSADLRQCRFAAFHFQSRCSNTFSSRESDTHGVSQSLHHSRPPGAANTPARQRLWASTSSLDLLVNMRLCLLVNQVRHSDDPTELLDSINCTQGRTCRRPAGRPFRKGWRQDGDSLLSTAAQMRFPAANALSQQPSCT